ncbi:alpha/beta hydrolase [Actinoplanes sp. NPDC049265]|uniref:alpha/beta hydrolase n=1 Tax=Actinoplanes sp. NPDC049265 TaxID=3363902 RepID=UPI00371D7AC5
MSKFLLSAAALLLITPIPVASPAVVRSLAGRAVPPFAKASLSALPSLTGSLSRCAPSPARAPSCSASLFAGAAFPPFAVAYRAAAAAMRQAGGAYANWADSSRHFLSFDPTGDGTAAEVVGDLATADRIVVVVPGVDNALKDFDRGLGSVARRAPAVQARAIWWKLRTTDRDANVAVIAWLGYDPPEGIGLAAVREQRARAGAQALSRFVQGVHDRRPSARVTLVGHSYGAIVVGLAAPHLPYVHDVVALGAPGMGAAHAGDLGGARVWSALAPRDWMRRIPQLRVFDLGHGRRPSDPSFGALPLPTAGVDGHDYYLTPGSATLDALANVVLGTEAAA